MPTFFVVFLLLIVIGAGVVVCFAGIIVRNLQRFIDLVNLLRLWIGILLPDEHDARLSTIAHRLVVVEVNDLLVFRFAGATVVDLVGDSFVSLLLSYRPVIDLLPQWRGQ